MTFPAYAADFEAFPKDGRAFNALHSTISKLEKVNFKITIVDPFINQGQMSSDFDERLCEAILSNGCNPSNFAPSADISKELDFAFSCNGACVAVEIEKANREKILKDILKAHMYLAQGADFALIVSPRNYAHSKGVWNLFKFGKEQFQDCLRYSFGSKELFSRILLLGYTHYDAQTQKPFNTKLRKIMREQTRAR